MCTVYKSFNLLTAGNRSFCPILPRFAFRTAYTPGETKTWWQYLKLRQVMFDLKTTSRRFTFGKQPVCHFRQGRYQGYFQGPPIMDPFVVSFPNYSHIFRDSCGSGLGIVWETHHKRVPLLGVPGNPTVLNMAGMAMRVDSWNELSAAPQGFFTSKYPIQKHLISHGPFQHMQHAIGTFVSGKFVMIPAALRDIYWENPPMIPATLKKKYK